MKKGAPVGRPLCFRLMQTARAAIRHQSVPKAGLPHPGAMSRDAHDPALRRVTRR
jgi:hypothetical protein